MNKIQLPDDLNLDTIQPVQIFDYISSKDISKRQIILNKNTFSFLINGTKEVFLNDAAIKINNDRFIIMKMGNCLMTERCTDIDNYRSILLFFSTDSVLKLVQKYQSSTIAPIKCKSIYSFQYDNYIKRFVYSLIDILTLPEKLKGKLLENKLDEILLYLINLYGSDFLFSMVSNTNNLEQNLIQVVESNIYNKLSLKELSFLANMSISSFKRNFKKIYSQSPAKWFQIERMKYAYTLLKHNQMKASEIYLELGYKNLSSFIQAYKANHGITTKFHQKF